MDSSTNRAWNQRKNKFTLSQTLFFPFTKIDIFSYPKTHLNTLDIQSCNVTHKWFFFVSLIFHADNAWSK